MIIVMTPIMTITILLLSIFIVIVTTAAADEKTNTHHDDNSNNNNNNHDLKQRIKNAKMNLWSRGQFHTPIVTSSSSSYFNNNPTNTNTKNDLKDIAQRLENDVMLAPIRLGPIKDARRVDLRRKNGWTTNRSQQIYNIRGGSSSSVNEEGTNNQQALQSRLLELGAIHGAAFTDAIRLNVEEHKEDCRVSCEMYYCDNNESTKKDDMIDLDDIIFDSYNFGSVPPEDFADEFGFPLDVIKVTSDYEHCVSSGSVYNSSHNNNNNNKNTECHNPNNNNRRRLFTPQTASDVINIAEDQEHLSQNEFESGKYKLAGRWLTDLPLTREWFNEMCRTTFFPIFYKEFPDIVSSPKVLRAHSVSLLKYNSSHPRTDVHIDNGILAMTIAMTPMNDYVGGGTFYEHFGSDNILPMDVGQGTFRPGSVRHGGHRVSKGTRYVLGAFILIEDRVEHVRRLKNRGSELRRKGKLDEAAKHFEWALAINPKCTTCLKDWAEIFYTKKQYALAEEKIRRALNLLENLDSDALFTLGVILSDVGKDDESIDAYRRSLHLNAEDAELCYNLGVKLGDQKAMGKGDHTNGDVEMEMYARAVKIDPKFGGAWINWGTALAERGNIDDAEVMFLKAIRCPEVKAKAMINLALVYHGRTNTLAAGGNLIGAKRSIIDAAKYLDKAKPMFDDIVNKASSSSPLSPSAEYRGKSNSNNDKQEAQQYLSRYEKIRLDCHRLAGSIFAGLKDFPSCEAEFRKATKNFPNVQGSWEMLARVLQLQGKVDEAQQVMKSFKNLQRQQ